MPTNRLPVRKALLRPLISAMRDVCVSVAMVVALFGSSSDVSPPSASIVALETRSGTFFSLTVHVPPFGL